MFQLMCIEITLVYSFELYFIYYFPSISLRRKYKYANKLIGLLCIIIFLINYYLYTHGGIKITLEFVFLILLSLFLYSGNWMEKIYYASLSYMLIQIENIIFYFFNNILCGLIIPMTTTYLHFFLFFLIKPLFLILFYFAFKKFTFNSFLLRKKDWIVFIVISLLEIIFFWYINYVPDHVSLAEIENLMIFTFLLSVFMIVIFIAFHIYLRTYIFQLEARTNAEIQLQSTELNKKLLEQLKSANEQNKRLRHDLKNHILTTKYKIQNNPSDAEHYLDELAGKIEEVHMIQSSNEILNYIVNAKVQIMDEKHIQFECIYQDSLENIAAFDMTTIFGNLLDNAIEAQKGVNDPWIHLHIIKDPLSTSIIISNSYNKDKIKTENGKLITTKAQTKGFGIENIENAIKKYDGIIHYELEDTYFQMTIRFPYDINEG